jgi:hypothetical protein
MTNIFLAVEIVVASVLLKSIDKFRFGVFASLVVKVISVNKIRA